MGTVIAFRHDSVSRSARQLTEPATIIILPMVRIERDHADQWNVLPSDSAPPAYTAPDHENA